VEATETLDDPTKLGGNPWERKEEAEREGEGVRVLESGEVKGLYIMEEREKGRYQEHRN